MAQTNAAFKLRRGAAPRRPARPAAASTPATCQLQEALDLHTVPDTIECFDISNFQGKETVASLVFFKGGRAPQEPLPALPHPAPSRGWTISPAWRRCSTATTAGWPHKDERPADLVVVDGGAGQLGRGARRCWRATASHDTELIGLAKREETIVPRERRPVTSAAQAARP